MMEGGSGEGGTVRGWSLLDLGLPLAPCGVTQGSSGHLGLREVSAVAPLACCSNAPGAWHRQAGTP